MKATKILSLTFILFTAMGTNAQVKVNTNGSIWQGYAGYANIYMGTYTALEPTNGQYYTNAPWALEVWGNNFNIWKPWPTPFNGIDRNYYLFINPAGGVGIGKAPTHSGICLDVNGHIYANNYMLTSDERLKTDIKSLSGKTNLIYNLNGKSYKKQLIEEELSLPDIKDEKGNIIKKYEKSANRNKNTVQTNEFGFLAQELKKVFPELVSQDTLGYYYVNYIGLIPVIVETLKEQKTQIENQSKQIENLKTLVEKLINSKK